MNRLPGMALFLIALAVLTMPLAGRAAARTRISTGGELYDACKVLTEFMLNPQGPTPRPGLYCRQFIEGYFRSAKYVHDDDDAKSALGLPLVPTDCAPVPGPNSYDQLANKIVQNAQWHPELLGRPAAELAMAAFGNKPPC